MSGPRFFNAAGPVPVSLSGAQRRMLTPAQRRALGDLPPFDRSAPGIWPTNRDEAFIPPAFGPSDVPMLPGAPGVAAPVDTREINLRDFANIGIQVSATAPVWQKNFYRCYLLIQNLDAFVTILVSFGTQPNVSSALQLPPSTGFEWDSAPPNSAVYVSAIGTPTVQPIGIEGSLVAT